jgi:micrococcal nuclease
VDFGRDPELKALELQARAEKRGLWVDPNPIPPWVWRRMKRQGRQ